MTTHRLKTWPLYFEMVRAGRKPFEYRRNDRDFKAGDRLVLQETDTPQPPVARSLPVLYTGREVTAEIVCVLDNTCPLFEGLPAGFCLLGLGRIEERRR